MTKKHFLLILSFLSFGYRASAQMFLYSSDTTTLQAHHDSSGLTLEGSQHALHLIVATNLAVWGFDRYVTDAPFARIGLGTIRDNFRKGFVWDNDVFSTNLFFHPYHGGLYFNAARSNGIGYWSSLPFSLCGSLMWEYFMEREYPSINDLLATGIGGSGFGEVTFRLSDLLIDERTHGWERIGREALAFLVSPVRGVDRLMSGRIGRHSRKAGRVLPLMPIRAYISTGHRFLYDDAGSKKDASHQLTLDAGLFYGNPYDEDNEQPYDYFAIKTSFNLLGNQPFIGHVTGIGMLYSTDLPLQHARRSLALGLFQHFNYMETRSDIDHASLQPFKMTETVSVGPGYLYKSHFGRKSTLLVTGYLSGILLGSAQTDHYNVNHRDYNLGSGFSSKMNVELQLAKRLVGILSLEDYRLYTWQGNAPGELPTDGRSSQGDVGKASLSLSTLSVNYKFSRRCFLHLRSGVFYRKSEYRYYDDVEHMVAENKLGIGVLL